MIVLVEGISFIPNQGNQTQKIPPITSVKDNKVNSAAGIFLDPIEYKISPKHTKVPCSANNPSFLPDDKKLESLFKITAVENKQQNTPAIATVVNLGVSFFHLKLTENIENPKADASPNIKPAIEFFSVLPTAITTIPIVAIPMDTQTPKEIFSFKNKKPKKAVINGIAARHNKVIAAVVCVIDHIKVIMAIPSPIPPIKPAIPAFL